jgi:hypothetical protein
MMTTATTMPVAAAATMMQGMPFYSSRFFHSTNDFFNTNRLLYNDLQQQQRQ